MRKNLILEIWMPREEKKKTKQNPRSSLIWGKMTGQMKERKEEISRASPVCMKEGSMEPKWKTSILLRRKHKYPISFKEESAVESVCSQ